jgi:hypothetical protein
LPIKVGCFVVLLLLILPFSEAEVVEVVDENAWWVSLALDPSARPHLAYVGRFSPYLKYAYKEGGVWKIEILPLEVRTTSIALDSGGHPWITCQDYLSRYPSCAFTSTILGKSQPLIRAG